MIDQHLVCPHCGDANLYSTEEITVDYSITASVDEHGEIKVEHTGEDSRYNDEGAQYAGQIYCRQCYSEWTEQQLLTEAAFAEQHPSESSADGDSVDAPTSETDSHGTQTGSQAPQGPG